MRIAVMLSDDIDICFEKESIAQGFSPGFYDLV
jgi:hypothetical protein